MFYLKYTLKLDSTTVIKKIAKRLFIPVFLNYLLLKFGGIWGLKEYIRRASKPSALFIEAYELYFSRYGSWIGYRASFADIPCFPHGLYGIFISANSKIGKNTVIFHQVTIGSNTLSESDKAGAPIIGNSVYIGAGAKIIGNIVIGDRCRIGANAVVYKSMPPNSVAVQAPTRVMQKTDLDNRYFSFKNGKRVFYEDGAWIEVSEKNGD